MATDVLQRFLTKRLFDVGGDDNRVTPLRSAAADVASLLKASPQRTATLTMVAIDDKIRPDEPLVSEVMKVLEKHWHSYAGAFADDKLPTVARAILLHALSSAMGSEPIAAAFTLTARTMLPLLGGIADRDIWADIVGDAERRLMLRAEREWALPSAAKVSEIELSLAAGAPLTAPGLARDWLAKRLEAAAGPQNAAGEDLESANQHFPNAGKPWSHEFGPIAATAITNAVNTVTKTVVTQINERETAGGVRGAVADYVRSTAEALTRTSIGLERRTALLWWKEALFSPAAGRSYRDLDPSTAAALAAVDASAQTGAFAPRMAEAMVRETLRSIATPAMVVERTLVEHGGAIGESEGSVRGALDAAFGTIHSEPGRAPLGALLRAADAINAAVVEERLGLPQSTKINAIELGIWLFRDLQAAGATPAPAKRKRGGSAA